MTYVNQPTSNGVFRGTRHMAKALALRLGASGARVRAMAGRPPRFSGAYESRAAALAAIPAALRDGYDDETIADVSFPQMCERAAFDYPLIYWLSQLAPEVGSVVDAGGHLGTKYIAFSEVLDLSGIAWTVQDLPGIIAAARKRQAVGALPAGIDFVSDPKQLPCPDLLLASGLLQYLDRPLRALLDDLPGWPRYILLNKVAMRDGPAIFTIERIGHGRVPYQIRDRAAWAAELDALGYDIRDSWEIGELAHRIPTHPWLGQSESRGYLLERRG